MEKIYITNAEFAQLIGADDLDLKLLKTLDTLRFLFQYPDGIRYRDVKKQGIRFGGCITDGLVRQGFLADYLRGNHSIMRINYVPCPICGKHPNTKIEQYGSKEADVHIYIECPCGHSKIDIDGHTLDYKKTRVEYEGIKKWNQIMTPNNQFLKNTDGKK